MSSGKNLHGLPWRVVRKGEASGKKKHHERDLVCSVHQGYMKA